VRQLLLSAFEPFAGELINPSIEAARAVAKLEFPDTAVNLVELPVERYRAVDIAIARMRSIEPEIMIMLGLAGGRFRINPERVAINVDDFRIPDNAGNQPLGEPIIADGPAGYFSTLPIQAIADRLKEANVPAAVSNTAGTYLCNRLFYSVMHYIAVERVTTAAGFIHLPYLHEQTVNKESELPSMSLATIVEGVRLAVEVSLSPPRVTTN